MVRVSEPIADRPHLPGYGISDDRGDLLPWSWAEERLAGSTEMWLATIGPGGRPHVMPVWAVWLDAPGDDGDDRPAVWLSTGRRSAKARNLRADPRCTVTTDDTRRPLVIEGTAVEVTGAGALRPFVDAVNTKYGPGNTVEFFLANHVFRIVPERAFGLEEERFTETPTRWTFPPPATG
jgi:PPOX class probable F420-dependent enzyme